MGATTIPVASGQPGPSGTFATTVINPVLTPTLVERFHQQLRPAAGTQLITGGPSLLVPVELLREKILESRLGNGVQLALEIIHVFFFLNQNFLEQRA